MSDVIGFDVFRERHYQRAKADIRARMERGELSHNAAGFALMLSAIPRPSLK